MDNGYDDFRVVMRVGGGLHIPVWQRAYARGPAWTRGVAARARARTGAKKRMLVMTLSTCGGLGD
jgi:hypothetical protein